MSAKPSEIFKRPISIDGKVVMRPDVFYVGLNKEGRVAITRLILDHGGKVTAQPSPTSTNVIALIDPHAKANPDGSPVYSVNYISECVQKGSRLDKELFRIKPQRRPGPNNSSSAKKEHVAALRRSAYLRRNGDASRGLYQKKAGHTAINGTPNRQGTSGKIEERTNTDLRSKNAVKNAAVGGADQGKAVRDIQHFDAANDSWTDREDRTLIEVYEDGLSGCKKRELPKNFCDSLQFWSRMEIINILPERRNARECCNRIEQLLKNGGFKRRARLLPPNAVGHANEAEDTDDVRPVTPINTPQKVDEGVVTTKGKESSVGSSTVSVPLSTAKTALFKRQPKNETQQKIFRTVQSLAKRCHVSKKNAFRALRQERGNWKKALQALRGKLSTGDL